MAKKRAPTGQTIGGIVAAAGGGTITVGLPDDIDDEGAPSDGGDRLSLSAPGIDVVVDLAAGGRLASFVVDGRELLVTEGFGHIAWGSFPMVPFAGRVRDGRFVFRGQPYELPIEMPPHAIHGTVLDRRWERIDDRTISTDLGPSWPFAGHAVQRFEIDSRHFVSRLELHADEPMPASIGWHPWFRRRPPMVAADPFATAAGGTHGSGPGALELSLEAGAMLRRDASGIATEERIVPPPPGPWDDCFTDLRHPPVLRWPRFLELIIESDCLSWVVYTVPADALCVEPQTAPPDALNTGPAIVEPGRPLIAEMIWTWRSLAD